MKIGLLTFHRGINQGSILQAFCAFRLLQQWFPNAKVEIIDLVRPDLRIGLRNLVTGRVPFIRLDRLKRYQDFSTFLNKRVNLSESFTGQQLNKQIDFINKQDYDFVFTGSDTVWMASKKLSGGLIPNIYFLPNSIKAKRCSIAASVDPVVNIDSYLRSAGQIRGILNNYNVISVRDQITRTILEKVGVSADITKISDPAILYDFASDFGIEKRDYLGGEIRRVGVNIGKESKFLINALRDLGYSASYACGCPRLLESSFFGDVKELCGYDALVTNRFHFSIVALKLSSSLVVNVELVGDGRIAKGKGEQLFEAIGLKDYFIKFGSGGEREFVSQLVQCFERWSEDRATERRMRVEEFVRSERLRADSLFGES